MLHIDVSHAPGSLKVENFQQLQERIPARIIEKAVWGMLPKGPLGREFYRRLFVYADDQIIYKKDWFNNLAWRIKDLFYRENYFKNIERTVWFEDIPNFPKNGILSVRQNPHLNPLPSLIGRTYHQSRHYVQLSYVR